MSGELRPRCEFLRIHGNLDEDEAINGQIYLYCGDEDFIPLRTMIQDAMNSRRNTEQRNSRRHSLNDMDTAWAIEGFPGVNSSDVGVPEVANRIEAELAEIIIPQVRFIKMPISQAVEMITELSIKDDTATDNLMPKAVTLPCSTRSQKASQRSQCICPTFPSSADFLTSVRQ